MHRQKDNIYICSLGLTKVDDELKVLFYLKLMKEQGKFSIREYIKRTGTAKVAITIKVNLYLFIGLKFNICVISL